jgi:hypothetical protein
MDITALLRPSVLLLALLVALSGCFGSAKTAAPTQEQTQAQAEKEELERLRQAEKDRVAQEEAFRKVQDEKRKDEERKKAETALPGDFGKPVPPAEAAAGARPAGAQPAGASGQSLGAPPLIAGTPSAGTEQPAVPYDQAFPPIPDRLLRVAVVSAPSQANAAERIGVMLSQTERDNLERSLGMGLRIAYLSQSDRAAKSATSIQYRDKFMQAAVRLAGVIPEAQRVERMTESEANRMGVDVLINVGADLH